MPWFQRVYERQELFERVWSKPMRDIAKEYGISDVALKKVCRKLDVPTPPQGHWLRVAAGRDVDRPALPPAGESKDRLVISWWEDSDPIATSADALDAAARERAAPAIAVEPALGEPHRLVKQAMRLLAKAKPYDGCVSSRRGGLDIIVAPANVDRALRIANALITALEARGLPVELVQAERDEEHGASTRAIVSGQAIEFGLSEVVKIAPAPTGPPRKPRHLMSMSEYLATPRQPTVRRDRIPTGTLTLSVYSGQECRHWRDRKHRRLETFLHEFIAHLFIAADWMTQKHALDLERRRKAREDEIKRAEEERALAEKKRRIDDLRRQLEEWRLARDLRAFASEIRGTVVAASMKVTEGGPLHKYVAFIMSYADEVDPLADLRREVELVPARK